MQLGQHRAQAIPFWCSILLACCMFVGLPACSDGSQNAAENAALAEQALASNDLRTARSAIIAAIQERDDILAYHLLRGRIELASGSPSAAYDAYSDARALDAANSEALLAVAQLGLTTGNLQQSFDATEEILILAPGNLDALLIRGIHAIVRRNYPEALEFGEKILAIAPGHEGGVILKSRALFMSRKPREALSALDEITGSAADSEPAALTRLEIFRALRQPRDLSAEFTRLRELRPKDAALAVDEANFRFKMGERQSAHQLLTNVMAATDTDAERAESASALWGEYGLQDLPSDALTRINRSGSTAARQTLARLLIRLDRVPETAATLRALPESSRSALQARYLAMIGKSADARRLAEALLSRDSTNCDALIAVSESALALGQNESALRYAQQAAAECPVQPAGWMAAANAYKQLERDGGVSRVYVQALDTNKQSTELTAAYSNWLASEGRSREAVAMARRLTRYAPALISAWTLYGELCRRFDPTCISAAEAGMENAKTLFGIDLPPGTPPPNGLFGRLVER